MMIRNFKLFLLIRIRLNLIISHNRVEIRLFIKLFKKIKLELLLYDPLLANK